MESEACAAGRTLSKRSRSPVPQPGKVRFFEDDFEERVLVVSS